MTGTDIRVSLQTCAALDGEIIRLKKAHRDSLASIKNFQDTFIAREREQSATTAHLKELKKRLHEKELELTEATLALKTKTTLLDRCTNGKQYETLMHEISELEVKKPLLEATVFDLMTREGDEAEARAESIRTFATQEQEMKKNILLEEQKSARILTTIDVHIKNRDAVLLQFPVAWQTLYKKLSATIENPLVRVLNNTCSGCFYAVSANEVDHIHKEYLGRCKECFRMLFEFAPELEVLVTPAVHQ